MKPEETTPLSDFDEDLLDYLLTLSPAERVKRIVDAAELVRRLRKAGEEHYGFDPRDPSAAR